MTRKASAEDYAALAAEAEKAVGSVKDPELKRVAFEKILDTLLSGGPPRTVSASSRSSHAASAARSAGRPEPPKHKVKMRAGPKGYIEETISDGFFGTPKTIAQVKAELGNRGHHIPLTGLSGPLQALCREKKLRRQKTEQGNKQVYLYANW